ncbi:MAG: choice-of-anchor V domain-containing protein [Bacteroidota bacterium]
MNLYKYLFLLFFLFFLLAFMLDLSSFSDGPPAERTSAPGELNCTNGYCHNGFPLNSGPGMASLSGDIFETGFEAGETYTLTAKVQQDGQQRFGFMVVAYDSVRQVSSGEMMLAEPDRTQITPNNAGDRSYVTHDPANITADSSEWTFKWKAPEAESFTENVSFYATFVAANNNNAAGDYVYAVRADARFEQQTTSIQSTLSEQELSVRFEPINKRILLLSEEGKSSPTDIEILGLDGKSIYNKKASLIPYMSFSIPTDQWLAGVYILKIKKADKHRIQKFRWIP